MDATHPKRPEFGLSEIKLKRSVMLKISAVLLMSALSLNASAEPKVDYLVLDTQNGSVSPAFRIHSECVISNDGKVYLKQTGGVVGILKSTRKIKWKDIRNEDVLQSLIIAAKSGQMIYRKGLVPVGGPTTTYSTVIKNKVQKPIQTLVSGKLMSVNRSEAAARLIKFMDLNCSASSKD